MRRLPGLSDPRAAYETGRALRMIVRLFDQAGAPEIVGRQFIDNLAGAVVAEHMRYPSRPWGPPTRSTCSWRCTPGSWAEGGRTTI